MAHQFDQTTVAFLKQLAADDREKKQKEERQRTVEDVFTALRASGFQLPMAAPTGTATTATMITGPTSVSAAQQENDEMKKLIRQLQQKVETLEAEKRQETAVIERLENTLTPDPKVSTRAKSSAGEGAKEGDSVITISLQELLQIRDSTRSEYRPKDPKKRCVFDLSSAASALLKAMQKKAR